MSNRKPKKQEQPMATATATKKVDPGALIADRAAVLEHADSILEAMFLENRPASYEELDFFNGVCNWDRPVQNEHFRRVGRRVRLQQIAGCSKDRQELKQFSEAAQTAFENKGPELLAQIEKLQSEHSKLEKTATSSARRYQETQEALEGLTTVCSPSVTAEVAVLVTAVKADLGAHVADLQGQLSQFRSIVAGPQAQRHHHGWDQLRRFDESLVIKTVANQMISYSFAPGWPAARAKLEAEIPVLEREISRMQTLLDSELEKAREPLKQFWR